MHFELFTVLSLKNKEYLIQGLLDNFVRESLQVNLSFHGNSKSESVSVEDSCAILYGTP